MNPITSLLMQPPQLVSELIDETSGRWREDMICQCFLPIDVAAILSIPLCTRRQTDFRAWNYDSKGIFLVRSAYRMMINTKIRRENYFDGNTDSSNLEANEKAGFRCGKQHYPQK
jgi:hypothetical protein